MRGKLVFGKDAAKKKMNDACSRGTNVHLMCEQYLKGEEINCPAASEMDKRLFNQLKIHFKKINEVYGQEIVLYSDMLRVAGRCDFVRRI